MFKKYTSSEVDSPLSLGRYGQNKHKIHSKKYSAKKILFYGVHDSKDSEFNKFSSKLSYSRNKPRPRLSNSQPNVKSASEEIKQIVNIRNKRES